MGDQSRRMVRQSQGSEQENGQTSQGSEQGQQRIRQEQEQDTGPRRNTHQGRVCRSGHPLNTPA
ncbi:unnamed protein product [Staurois parvus]|uniref:Uncharacterized protein n=1 Tax=Staurois parvus TaxID=386267 RepID=A0ABN9C9N8_9NEOB|nr:unnamed protein product [Staurois parvus]